MQCHPRRPALPARGSSGQTQSADRTAARDVLVREGPSTLGVTELLDALLIRLILRPVPLWPTGHAALWSPAWLRKVLPKISFSH
ncbi:hypothetical protein [Rhodococcus opacus]|uniref:hypothetical protein n=1 Tax=Rhodococcus opacus TaxID=37919 RepID=UPI00155A318C|nr:hypothetical protein [Rhodococcus opacus]